MRYSQIKQLKYNSNHYNKACLITTVTITTTSTEAQLELRAVTTITIYRVISGGLITIHVWMSTTMF